LLEVFEARKHRFDINHRRALDGFDGNLTGAAFSHAAVGDPILKVIVPLVILGIATASWGPPACEPQARDSDERASDDEVRCSRDTTCLKDSGGTSKPTLSIHQTG